MEAKWTMRLHRLVDDDGSFLVAEKTNGTNLFGLQKNFVALKCAFFEKIKVIKRFYVVLIFIQM